MQAVDFSTPYYDVKQAVVTIATRPVAGADSIADLRNAKLGAQVGTTSYDAIVNQIDPAIEPAVFTTNDDAKLALANGQVNAIVVDLPTAFFITSAEFDGGRILGQLPLGGGTPEQFARCSTGTALSPGACPTPSSAFATRARWPRWKPNGSPPPGPRPN